MSARFKWFLRTDVLLCSVAVAITIAFPALDIWFSGLFYDESGQFVGVRGYAVNAVYRGTEPLAVLGMLYAMLLIGRNLIDDALRTRAKREAAVFVLIVLAVGPGLIINAGLKQHWGRARPVAVMEFGGNMQYSPALVPSRECSKNCSFVSGHASVGFALFVFGWLTQRRRWFAIGWIVGLLIGLTRILQGRHFLTDIVFSGFTVWFVAHGTYHLFSTAGWLRHWEQWRNAAPSDDHSQADSTVTRPSVEPIGEPIAQETD